MTRFPSARHLASWAGQCPGNDQSAGKRRSGKTRNGSKWLDFALEEAAMAAIRVKANYPAAQYGEYVPDRADQRVLDGAEGAFVAASGLEALVRSGARLRAGCDSLQANTGALAIRDRPRRASGARPHGAVFGRGTAIGRG
jgi:hypothetical protein